MSRIKHPVRAIREPFGTAGLIVACIALIAAIGGTAWAAAKLNSTQKKEVEKIAKKFAGKPGANGAPGAQGPAGPAGANGKDGTSGTNGKSVAIGTATAGECTSGGSTVEIEGEAATKKHICNGTNGTNGKSIVTEVEAAGANCTNGGSSFHQEGSATKVYACNGANGQTGFTEKLPAGKTETGNWGFGVTTSTPLLTPISFPIPLAAALDGSHVHFVGCVLNEETFECEEEASPPTQCPGSAADPAAEQGNLCVYEGFGFGVRNKNGEPTKPIAISVYPPNGLGPVGAGALGAGKSGAILTGEASGTEGSLAYGSWAVTAP